MLFCFYSFSTAPATLPLRQGGEEGLPFVWECRDTACRVRFIPVSDKACVSFALFSDTACRVPTAKRIGLKFSVNKVGFPFVTNSPPGTGASTPQGGGGGLHSQSFVFHFCVLIRPLRRYAPRPPVSGGQSAIAVIVFSL